MTENNKRNNKLPAIIYNYALQIHKEDNSLIKKGLDRLEDDKWLKADEFLAKGLKYAEENNLEEAEMAYLSGINICPEHDGLHNNLGCIYIIKANTSLYPQSEYEKAISEFLRAIEINYDNAHAHYNLALVYDILGKYEKAEREWLVSIAIRPDLHSAYYYLADLYYERNCEEKALRYYREYINSYDGKNDNNFKDAQEKIYLLSLNKEEREVKIIDWEMQRIRRNPIGELYGRKYNMELLHMFKSAYKHGRLHEVLSELKSIIFKWDDPSEQRFKEKYESGEYNKGNPCKDMAYRIGKHLAECAPHSWLNPSYALNYPEYIARIFYKSGVAYGLKDLARKLRIYSESDDKYELAKEVLKKINEMGAEVNDADFIIDDVTKEYQLNAIEFWKISVEKCSAHVHGLAELRNAIIGLKLFDEGIRFLEQLIPTSSDKTRKDLCNVIAEIRKEKLEYDKIKEWVNR
ncbi:MAG: tetratricopeptide repeat protein [candidate division WOR-3 bacterium]